MSGCYFCSWEIFGECCNPNAAEYGQSVDADGSCDLYEHVSAFADAFLATGEVITDG